MDNSCMFAVFNDQEQQNLQSEVIFFASYSANAVNILGYLIPCGLPCLHCSCSWSNIGKGSLSYIHILTNNFIRKMTKNNEIRPSVNNSTAASTPISAKTELQQEIEAKNMAYAFILSKNLFSEFIQFAKANSDSCVLNLDIPQLLTIQDN